MGEHMDLDRYAFIFGCAYAEACGKDPGDDVALLGQADRAGLEAAIKAALEDAGGQEVRRLRRELEDWERRWTSLKWCHSGCGEDKQSGGGGPRIGGSGGLL